MQSACLSALTLMSVMACAVTAAAVTTEPFVEYTIGDAFPEDGIGDDLILPSESRYIGQVTGPGPADFQQETFLEYDLRSAGLQIQATLNLILAYSGSDKSVSISTFDASGVPTLANWNTGTLLNTFSLPPKPSPGEQHHIAIDVTSVVNDFVQAGQDFLGFRVHDAVYIPPSPGNTAQIALGGGRGTFPQILDLRPIPEPAACSLALVAAAAIHFRSRSRKLSCERQRAQKV